MYKVYNIFILNNLKVLFVGNEDEIVNNDKYIKIKEKIIRHTINIYGMDNGIFKNIAQDILKKCNFYKEYLFDTHMSKLINIFCEMECINIRTFLTYLDLSENLFKIEKILKNEEILKNKEAFEKILLELALILIELRSDNKDKIEMFYKTDNSNQSKLLDYESKIYNLNIFRIDKDYNLFNTIRNYIKTGYLDDSEIKNSYQDQINTFEKKEFDIYCGKLWQMNNFKYKPEEIKEAINKIFHKIEECLNNKIAEKYIDEYIEKFNNLQKYIDGLDKKIYIDEIKRYIELRKRIIDYKFDNLDLNDDSNIDKTALIYDYHYRNYDDTKKI